jgi:hypothetical protein
MDVGVMIKNRKAIILALVAVLIIAIATTGAIMIINSNNNKKVEVTPTIIPATNKTADTLRKEAEAARIAGDVAERKLLLSQAAQKLSEQPKSDANTNAQVDVAAQQCMAGVKSACKGY